MLRDIFFYLKKSLTFFDLKAKYLTPVVFVVSLGIYVIAPFVVELGESHFQGPAFEILVNLFVYLFISMISFVYLSAAIYEAKNETYTAKDCIRKTKQNFIMLLIMTILKSPIYLAQLEAFAEVVSYVVWIAPLLLVLFFFFLFPECIILDSGTSIIEGLRKSGSMTKGKKLKLLFIILFSDVVILYIIFMLISIFVENDANNFALIAYATTFIFTIYSLMYYKRLAYLYVDVEYRKAEDE